MAFACSASGAIPRTRASRERLPRRRAAASRACTERYCDGTISPTSTMHSSNRLLPLWGKITGGKNPILLQRRAPPGYSHVGTQSPSSTMYRTARLLPLIPNWDNISHFRNARYCPTTPITPMKGQNPLLPHTAVLPLAFDTIRPLLQLKTTSGLGDNSRVVCQYCRDELVGSRLGDPDKPSMKLPV